MFDRDFILTEGVEVLERLHRGGGGAAAAGKFGWRNLDDELTCDVLLEAAGIVEEL